MRATDDTLVRRLRGPLLWLAAASASLAASGVAMAADDDDQTFSSSWSDGMFSGAKDAIQGAKQKIGLDRPAKPPVAEASRGCPTIGILPGTEAQRVQSPGTTGNTGLKYQFSLLNVGRECGVAGDRVVIKVGADGRVLLGPTGSAGHFDVPIRVAVFNIATQKAVESRLFKVPVNMAAGQTSVAFDFVSDSIAVTIPQGRAEDYNIKVGIDAGKGGGEAPVKTKHARKQKPAAEQSASR